MRTCSDYHFLHTLCACVVIGAMVVALAVPLQARVEIGGEIGLGFSSLGGEDSGFPVGGYRSDWSVLSKPSVSVASWITLGIGLFVHPEITYTLKGTRIRQFDTHSNYLFTRTWTLQYIDLSVLLGHEFQISQSLLPFVELGPVLSLSWDAEQNIDGFKQDISNAKSDMGIILGAGISYKLRGFSVFASSHYELSLTRAFGSPVAGRQGVWVMTWKDDDLVAPNVKNRQFKMATGVRFSL